MHTQVNEYLVAHMPAGLQSLEKKSKNENSGAMPDGDSETEKVTSGEFNTTLRFIESGGALRILRVLSKLFDAPTYIKISNWLVFNARSSECMQLCYLILSMLTAQPKFAGMVDQKGPNNTATASSTARSRHTREERLRRCAHMHGFLCVDINSCRHVHTNECVWKCAQTCVCVCGHVH